MTVFSSVSALISFAQQFLKERLDSLVKDVSICIKETCPFPGLLYCFSTTDLLGSLYKGDATGDTRKYGYTVGTTLKSQEYMIDMMGYSKEETQLLQQVFRHKIVHLAQPKSVKINNNRNIAWILDNDYNRKHMVLEKLSPPQPVITLTPNHNMRLCIYSES
jgi:hypothetical protein